MPDRNLEKIKQQAEKFYKSVKSVECPYFKESIAFNAKGLRHIKFKRDREARKRQDQFVRLKEIRHAPAILKKSHTLQEIRREQGFVEVKTNKRKERVLKPITYYGFVAIVKDGRYEKRFKVIVKQIEGGQKHFWSIIPFWKSNREIKLHSGNPETD